jgi:hypothetical protein
MKTISEVHSVDEPMIAEAIGQHIVLAMLRTLAPSSMYAHAFPEIAEAIATASNHDPLFPRRKDGCARTASILVAIAWHESRFHPNAVYNGSFGLYQIRPPSPELSAKILLLPRDASYVAIDLIRTSFTRPWGERSAWLSKERMQTAIKVFGRVFPDAPLLPERTTP